MNVDVEQEWKEEIHFGLSSLVRRGSRRSQARIKNNYLKPSNHFWPMRLAPNHPYSANNSMEAHTLGRFASEGEMTRMLSE